MPLLSSPLFTRTHFVSYDRSRHVTRANRTQVPTWTVDEFDITAASWVVATFLLGPDDGSLERDEIECQIQEFMKASFADSARPEKGVAPALPRDSMEEGLIPLAMEELMAAARREFLIRTGDEPEPAPPAA